MDLRQKYSGKNSIFLEGTTNLNSSQTLKENGWLTPVHLQRPS